jgi:phospholipase C
VVFLDPPYLSWWQADDHPHADPNAGQRYLRDVFQAFTESRHWERGAFVLTYDEWGGFFDHVRPPVLPDLLASPDDDQNYGQAGFRVPTILASPYSRPGYVDHRIYDHTSIMRFLEWRFLGAPADGPGTGDAPWALTVRDRNANNIGASLGAERPDPGVFDLGALPLREPTGSCDGTGFVLPPGTRLPAGGTLSAGAAAAAVTPAAQGAARTTEMQQLVDTEYFARVGLDVEPTSMAGDWANATN